MWQALCSVSYEGTALAGDPEGNSSGSHSSSTQSVKGVDQ